MSLSYRIRGSVPRAQINEKAIKVLLSAYSQKFPLGPKNIVTVKQLINRILAYSAIKISAKPPLLYSILNPETNSDSPSAKSKGVRLVSAKLEASHIKPNGGATIKNLYPTCMFINSFKLKLPIKIKKDTRIKAKLTSYEIVWATLRNPPSTAYFELDDQPLNRTVYTPRLVQQRKNRIPRLKLWRPNFMGNNTQTTRASLIAATGAAKYNIKFAKRGWVDSLVNNLIASANGWGTPAHPTLFGPLRIWMYPNTLRSSKVRNATPIKTRTTRIKLFNRTTHRSLFIITI